MMSRSYSVIHLAEFTASWRRWTVRKTNTYVFRDDKYCEKGARSKEDITG